MTKVSIITPVFNGERFIGAAAASVLSQTLTDWEWIIVDDGSTDGTAARLAALDDPRVRILRQANAGASAARNAGLDCARGAFVTFLDADDILPPEALARRMALLEARPDFDIVHGAVRVTSGGQPLRHYRPDPVEGALLTRLARLEEGVFFGVNYIIRRDRIGGHRFPVGLTHCEDLIFFLTLAHEIGLRYAAVEDVIYEYRIQPNSAMSGLEGLEAGYLELVRCCRTMPRLDAATRRTQERRVQRILFRSWLRRRRPLRALAAIFKVRRAAGGAA